MNWFLDLLSVVFGFSLVKRVTFTNDGRSGQIVYTDIRGAIEFYFEFGGGNCLAIVTVPDYEEWSAQTGRNALERASILNFVGSEIVRQQAPGGKYVITDEAIEVYSSRGPS